MIIEKMHPEKLAELIRKPKCPKDLSEAPLPDYDTSLALGITTMNFLKWDYSRVGKFLNTKHLPDWHRTVLSSVFADGSSTLAISCMHMYHSDLCPKNFYVSDQFFNTFKNVSAHNLRFCDINKPVKAYFHLPNKSLVDEDGDAYQDAYVYTGPASEFPSKILKENGNPPFDASENLISIAVISSKHCFTLTSYLPENENITLIDGFRGIPHVLNDGPKVIETELTTVPLVIAQIMKLLAYIGTGEADIRCFKNEFKLRGGPGSKPVNKERWKSQLDLELVGFDWDENILYQTEGWKVREHLRWQRYGPQYSRVKLKVIPAHTRERQLPTTSDDCYASL